MRGYRQLTVWQKSMDLVVAAYELTGAFPASERYGRTGQIRRAVESIPSNIAEGYSTGLPRRYAFHLAMSRGSVAEVKTDMLLALRLGFLPSEPAKRLRQCDEISRMLYRLRSRFTS
jgi:four helix bundle protein